jgi:uncharacterized damage-inducible protein DinB
MSMAELLLKELEEEGIATRKVLERMPSCKFDWTPHEKSLTLGRLASHVADIPGWVTFTVEQDSLDVSTAPPPEAAESAEQLVAIFDTKMAAAKVTLENTDDATLVENWKMTMGDMVLIDSPKGQVLRRWVLNHIVHHRAQLTVYLRLNDVAVPAVYGSSADEQDM